MSDRMQQEDRAELETALSLLEHYEPLETGGFSGLDGEAYEAPTVADLFAFGALDDENEASDLVADDEACGENSTATTDLDLSAVQAQGKARAKRVRKKTPDFNPNRARERRKEELLYLQTKVREMETQLAQLKRHGGGGTSNNIAGLPYALGEDDARSPATLMLEAENSPHRSAASVWQEMALRQSTQRRKAELENVRLKLILEGQLKVARSLESLLYKRNAVNPIQVCSTHSKRGSVAALLTLECA